jgi:hypothetical protein
MKRYSPGRSRQHNNMPGFSGALNFSSLALISPTLLLEQNDKNIQVMAFLCAAMKIKFESRYEILFEE